MSGIYMKQDRNGKPKKVGKYFFKVSFLNQLDHEKMKHFDSPPVTGLKMRQWLDRFGKKITGQITLANGDNWAGKVRVAILYQRINGPDIHRPVRKYKDYEGHGQYEWREVELHPITTTTK